MKTWWWRLNNNNDNDDNDKDKDNNFILTIECVKHCSANCRHCKKTRRSNSVNSGFVTQHKIRRFLRVVVRVLNHFVLRYLLFKLLRWDPPNPIASYEFKPFWLRNQAHLSTHLWRTCLERIFQVFFQLQLAKIVWSSFAVGERSEWIMQLNIRLPCCELKPFSRVISPLESE